MQDLGLAQPIPEGFLPVKQFKEDNSNGPNIYFRGDMWLGVVKYFRREVVVGADSWRGEVYFCFFVFYYLTNSEIYYFDYSIMKENVGWLEVKMDNLQLLLVKILDRKYKLFDDMLCLPLIKAH